MQINSWDIYDDFASGCYRCQRDGESYTIEDIAIAKQIATKLIKEDLQKRFQMYFLDRNYQWLPDERTVELK